MATLSFRVSADYQEVQRLREEIAKLKHEIKGTDAIQSPHAFNTLNAKLVQTSQELGKVEGKIISASAKMETDFKQKIFAASQGVNDFTEKIIAQKGAVREAQDQVRKLAEAYREAKKAKSGDADGLLSQWKDAKLTLETQRSALFSLTQEQATARLSVKRLNDEYKAFRQEGGGTAQTMDMLTSKMKGIAAAVMGGMGLKELASRIISVRAEFESMETSLKVLLGGSQERLNNIMGQIKEYALASPLNTKDMVGAVQMMTSFGIEAEKSIDYLKAIGDISMGNTGKFNSLALAFSQMSSAGKLMGQDLLQMVNAGFNPLEEISRKTGKSIGELKEEMSKGAISAKMVQDAFISVTSAGGKFYGMASEGAKTLNGQISMLQESFDNMFNEIGSKGEGVVMTAVQTATKLVENYEQVGRVILGLIETYGAYRVGLAIATIAENGHTLAMTLARAQILLTQKAQALLNSTMLANPYVLAATALGVLTGSIIATSDGLTSAEAAQKSVNEAVEEAKNKEEKYNNETERAIEIASNNSSANDDVRKSLNLLIRRYPSIIKKYIDEEGHLRNILDLKRKIAQINGEKTVGDYKKQADSDANRAAAADNVLRHQHGNNPLSKSDQDAYGKALEEYYKAKGIGKWSPLRLATSAKDVRDFFQNRSKEYEKRAERKTTENHISNFQETIKGMSNASLNRLQRTLNFAAGKKGVVQLTYSGLKGDWLTQEDIRNLSAYVGGIANGRKNNVTNKKDLDVQKKSLQAQLDGLSEIQAKGKEGAALRKQINDISEREKVYSPSNDTKVAKANAAEEKKKAAEAKKLSAAAERVNKQQLKDANEHQRALNDLENKKLAFVQTQAELDDQVEQSRINALRNGSEKTLAEMRLAHKKEMELIDKQKEDYLKKKQDKAEAEFKADPKNKNKTFDRSTVTLSADEQAKYDAIRKNTLKKQSNEEEEAQQQRIDALNAYLKEYGSFEEKKLAITQDYEEKIRKAGSVGEKATLEMQRDKEVEKAKNDDLQNSIDWNGVFSDLQGHTKLYLQGLRNQLQELLYTGNLPIDQMQTVSDKINAIDDELSKQQGIWDFVGERTREHNRLLKEAADAQERLNVARSEEAGANAKFRFAKMDVQKALSDAGVDMSIGDISTAKLNGKIDLTDEKFKGMATILQRLAVAEGKLTEARKKTADATNKAKQAEDGAKEKPADAVNRWFSDAQEFITKKGIAQLPDLLGSIGLGKAGEKVAKGLDGFNSAAGAAADFASGNYVGAAFKGISAIKSFGSALGIGAGNAAEVNRTTERLRESNEHLAERIDDLSEIIGDSAGARAVNAYDTALKAQQEINANNMEILKAQMDYHSAHHSNASYADDRQIASYNSDAQLAFKAAGVAASTIKGLSSIYNLTPEQLKAIKDFAPDLWRYLTEVGKYDKSEYWDAVVEQAGKTEELTEQIQNNLTQTSFDSLRSGFLDTLMDMDADAEEWSKNFEKMMFRSMVSTNVLDDKFNDWLKDFQKKWADKVKSGNMSQSDYADYRDEYNRKMEELKTQTNNFAASIGYSDTSSSQKATANGVTEITYEQANNIVALTTAGNVTREQIKDIVTLTNAKIDDFKSVQVQTKNIADELRTIQANSYIELQGIHEDTTAMSKAIKSMSGDVSDIKKQIKDM